MPELPEVETIRRQLAPHVEGRVLEAVDVLDERWCRPLAPAEMEAAIGGRRVERLGRRGKYLIWDLSDDVHLLMHLRMTGTLLIDPDPPSRHPRVHFALGARDRAFVAAPDPLAATSDDPVDLEPHRLVFDDPR